MRRLPSLRGALGVAPFGASLALTGMITVPVGMALAQARETAPPNPSLTLGLSLGLAVDDDDTQLVTGLGLDFVTRTREQTLSFSIDADAFIGEDGVDEDAFRPTLGLDYRFDNGASLLTFSADYERRQVEGVVFVLVGEGDEPSVDDDDLLEPGEVGAVDDDGTLETRQFALGLELFRQEVVGLEFGATLRERDYKDTSDPDLQDTERLTLNGALRLSVKPGLTFRLTTSRSETNEAGLLDADTVTESVGGRVAWAATPTVTLDFGLQDTQREETRNVLATVDGVTAPTGARETITNSGLTFDGSLVQDRPNGERRLQFSRRLTDERSIYDLSVGRALDLPGGGALNASIGLASFEDGNTVGIGRLSYQTELRPDAPFRASIARRALSDEDDQEIARTDLRMSYGVPLSPISRASLSLGLSHVDIIEGFEEDSTGGSVTLGYDRAISPDWSLSASYTHAASRDDGGETERDNRLSLTLGRTFDFSP